MKLEQLQSSFLDNILHPSSSPQTNLIDTDYRLSAEQRIEIYSEGYQFRLLEALMDTYPAVHTLLGDEDFDELGREYIRANPSKHFSLRYFGSQLFDFLKSHDTYKQSIFLSEMAAFEWHLRNAFDAKDLSVLTREELSTVETHEWAELCFKLHPSFSIVTFNWNTPFLWKAIIQNAPPRPPEELDESQRWIIWRPKLETQFRSADDLETLILREVLQEKSFTELCEFISLEAGEGAEQVAINYLSRWIDDGILQSLNN